MYVLHNITIMTSENIYHKLFNQQASYLMLTNLPFSPHCILLVLPLSFSPTRFFFPPSVPPISLSFLLLMSAAPLWRRTWQWVVMQAVVVSESCTTRCVEQTAWCITPRVTLAAAPSTTLCAPQANRYYTHMVLDLIYYNLRKCRCLRGNSKKELWRKKPKSVNTGGIISSQYFIFPLILYAEAFPLISTLVAESIHFSLYHKFPSIIC